MFTGWACVPPPQPEHVTQTHICLHFPSPVWTSLHLSSSTPPLSLSLSLSSFCPAHVLSPMPTDSHLLPRPRPRPLPSLFVSRSVDQFSVWLVGWSPLWLPRPSHLSLTPTYSPREHMAGCGAWTRGGFNKYISALVSSWQGSRVGYSVYNPEGGGVGMHAPMCLFLVDAFTPWPYCMLHVITGGVRVDALMWRAWAHWRAECESMTDAHHI